MAKVNNVWPLAAFISVATVVGTLLVGLRLYSRAAILKSVKSDDWVLLGACLTGFASYTLVMIMALRDMPTGTSSSLDTNFSYRNTVMLSTVVLALQNVISRLSLLLSYKRITPPTFRRMRITLNFFLIVFPITAIGFFILGVAPCWPPRLVVYGEEYYRALQSGKIKCIRASFISFVGTMYGLLGDLVVYVVPFIIISMAGLPKNQRIATYALFAFGGLVFIISIARLPFMLVFGREGLKDVPLSRIMILWMFGFAESNGLMIVAAVPTLRPLYRKIRGWNYSETDEEVAVSAQRPMAPMRGMSKFSI